MGVPKNGWFKMEKQIKHHGSFGGTPFQETSISTMMPGFIWFSRDHIGKTMG